MIFRQLFDLDSSTYTYLLGEKISQEAILIDPVLEHVPEYLALLQSLQLKLKFTLDTHTHADHITGAGLLREKTRCKTVCGANGGPDCVDLLLKDGQTLQFGNIGVKVLETPGHTNCSVTYLIQDSTFTGDALLIDGCGRTDFQNGSAETLWESVTGKLFKLPPDTLVYPGHDYNRRRVSTIAEQIDLNPRFAGKTKVDFVELMKNLKLDYPKRIHEALPLNAKCGMKV